MTAQVAGEVRAELARARISLTGLVRLADAGSFSYWQRRVSGVTPLDVEDLAKLAEILGCSPSDFLPSWAPRDSNPQPTDYKVAVPDLAARRALRQRPTLVPVRRAA